MCTNLRIIKNPRTYPDSPRYARYNLLPYATAVSTCVVACGKCLECLKRRQNDLAVRCNTLAQHYGSMVFTTLTYDNDQLPLFIRMYKVSRDTGEVFYDSQSRPLVRVPDKTQMPDESWLEVVRAKVLSMQASPHARVLTIPFEVASSFSEEYDYFFEITPSLYRRDVRLWLKNARVAYKREFGVPLPNFKYALIGEMGIKTCRPHYHLAFFGLSLKQVNWMTELWDYGFHLNKQVRAFNEDGSNGFEIASKYIGKYMVKGRFECDSVKCGLAERPRLCMSIGVSKLSQELISYYRCYDLFGAYNIEHPNLSKSDYLRLYEEVRKRSSISIGPNRYALPASFSKQIWSVVTLSGDSCECPNATIDIPTYNLLKQKYGKRIKQVKGTFRASSVRFALSSIAVDSYLESCSKQSENYFKSIPKDISVDSLKLKISSLDDFYQTKIDDSNSPAARALISFYSNSVF